MKARLLALLHGHGAMVAALGAAGAGGVYYLRRRQSSSAPPAAQAAPGVIVPMPPLAGGGVAPTSTTNTAPTQPAPAPAGGANLYGRAGTWIQSRQPVWPTPSVNPAARSWMTTTPNRGLGG